MYQRNEYLNNFVAACNTRDLAAPNLWLFSIHGCALFMAVLNIWLCLIYGFYGCD